MNKHFFLLLLCSIASFAQNTTILKGIVTNKQNQPIKNVAVKYNNKGTVTNAKGYYEIAIPIRKTITVVFSHVSYIKQTKKITLRSRSVLSYSPILIAVNEALNEVIINTNTNNAKGIKAIDVVKVKRLPGANAGVENLLMTLPGVNNNNELSTQYNVRGGNFDENLVYVNGIEVYRPFLVRSGQQEGLSFINPNMVQNIHFSAGGFQAKYGDKLSSVLDITYKKPTTFKTQVALSLVGGSATIEGQTKNKKGNAIVGLRHRNNSLFVNGKQIETNYNPSFTDLQTFASYQVNDKLNVDFLGNFSINNYNYTPISRKTRFGTLVDPIELIVFYSGQEKDKYITSFGALKTVYKLNNNITLNATASLYNTQEEEYFDILASYNLGEVDSNLGSENFGKVEFSTGIGSQLNHARNDLDALIANLQLKGIYKKDENQVEIGIKYQVEDIKDRIIEWEVIDSVGFAVRPPHHSINNQPYNPYRGELKPYQSIRATNTVTINRVSGFAQFSRKDFWNEHQVWYNIGARFQNWSVKANGTTKEGHFIFSPRAQFAIKPDWEKDLLFRISGGLYYQPPFYKELRDNLGAIHPEVKAQQSIHAVFGSDYSFTLWNRPFKLTTEIYYKHLSNVNPYTVDNVRIRYQAKNNATAYAAGIDIRLNGEFVPGNESWISLGLLKTQENIDGKGFIARPTDQRFKLGILFQDYVPNLPDLKAYLNLVYNSGVPGGSPSYADVYQFQNRLGAYKRADLGVSYIFVDANKKATNNWLQNFKELTAGLELFNLFDINNSITNTWVRDVYSKTMYGIPNYMTGRVLNFKIGLQF
ncbi:MAG: carboxypeptidase-like regulatory domain-containing protein [Polaribacter sp.]|nr:carboxypeptidase-like regulatory domain-containing protein [Polaribacter sp.]MDG1812129.1 carboxypeptidase-like regulatory domain-containing protein [Polaribacter sp.]MDG1994272.1 carboxypeptidase-like regulatory domain-containing protein [Polaribacter sp.]